MLPEFSERRQNSSAKNLLQEILPMLIIGNQRTGTCNDLGSRDPRTTLSQGIIPADCQSIEETRAATSPCRNLMSTQEQFWNRNDSQYLTRPQSPFLWFSFEGCSPGTRLFFTGQLTMDCPNCCSADHSAPLLDFYSSFCRVIANLNSGDRHGSRR